MRKRRLKKSAIIIPIIIIIIIIGIIIGINFYKKINSYSYKLEKLGYKKDEVEILLKLKDDQIENILKREKNIVIPRLVKQKYFIFENLDRYLKYYKDHEKEKKETIVSKVNVNRDSDYYTNTKPADTSKGYGILVNKYYYLSKDFAPDDLQDVSILYSYGEQKLRKEALEQFINMFNAAKAENITIIVNSSYRTYQYQADLWNNYSSAHGPEWADSYAARAGYSEHQTGLALDVTTYGVKGQEGFEKTKAYEWMINHSYEYGFILRYPKGKEDTTGYSYESWHYRYVGVDLAKKIHDSNLTFDEYYAYYMK